jgi:DNA-binding NtrC family response regulator
MSINAKIFLLDDDELILSMLSRVLKKEGYEVQAESSPRDVINKIRACSPDVILLDIMLPEKNGIDILKEIKIKGIKTQVVMLTSDDTAETAVKAMKLGAEDYLTKPFNTDEIKIVIKNIIEKESLKQEVTYLRKAYSELFERDIIGNSRQVRDLVERIEKIAQAGVSNVLITGESGTGKELIARHVHLLMHHMPGSTRYVPFVSLNCAAMPETLLESELFGYDKGAFTDAKSDKKGLFEVARGGSILLDEIGDMKTNLQSKFLRVLEERTIRRIGGKEEVPIDVTVIATTNRDLNEAVKVGEFRKDLFYRLSAFHLHIVPLRERPEDIPLFAEYFFSYFKKRYKNQRIKGFSPEAEKLITDYSWPGNVRELKNLIERFVVLESIEFIQPEHLSQWLVDPALPHQEQKNDGFILPDSGISLEEVEKDLIQQALDKAKHNKTLAAKLLSISYDTLRYQMKKFGLS